MIPGIYAGQIVVSVKQNRVIVFADTETETEPEKEYRQMTREKAIKTLIETGTLSTALLAPLGIAFETFLRLAQRSDADAITAKLIANYKAELQGGPRV